MKCTWTEADQDGMHESCTLEATFSVPVCYEVEDGVVDDRVPLCVQHALQASREGITT